VNILQALKKEATRFQKQIDSARQQLETVQAAIGLLGGKATGKRKRRVSKAARAKMARAQRARWAKIKAAKRGKE
jgi:hypothetical protein